MTVFGTKVLTRSIGTGPFLCQHCGVERTYSTMQVRRVFTLFSVPLIPVRAVAEYVECDVCRSTWRDDDARSQEGGDPVVVTAAEAEFRQVIKRVMVMMIMVDGEATEAEVALVRELYQRVDAAGVTVEAIAAEAREARRDPMSIDDYLSRVGDFLNQPGKQLVLKAALLVASADHAFREKEAAFLDRIAAGLHMPPMTSER